MSNFERMIQLAEETFDARHDDKQLQVDESVIHQLMELHPSTVSELDEGEGPCIWILLIPTQQEIKRAFLSGKIGEQELLDHTQAKTSFDSIYLCSAMVLPEYRKKGLAFQMTLDAIENIRKQHPILSLFVWPFSKEGLALAKKLSKVTGLILETRS